MKPLSADIFLARIAESSIGQDERSPKSMELVFQRGRRHCCYWNIPPEQEQAERLLWLVLEAVWGVGDMAVWPRDGSWWAYRERLEEIDPESPFVEVIRSPADPAALVGRDELSELVNFMGFIAGVGWRLSDDIHLIPADRSCILLLSHHQTLHVSATDLGTLKRVAEHLERAGFALAEAPQDWTFKHPGLIREAD